MDQINYIFEDKHSPSLNRNRISRSALGLKGINNSKLPKSILMVANGHLQSVVCLFLSNNAILTRLFSLFHQNRQIEVGTSKHCLRVLKHSS